MCFIKKTNSRLFGKSHTNLCKKKETTINRTVSSQNIFTNVIKGRGKDCR